MIQRLLLWAVGRYLGGPSSSWLYTSAIRFVLRAVKRVRGRRKVVDAGKLKVGHAVVVEHVPVTHARQIKAMKAEKKATKKVERAAAAEARAVRRARRRDRRRRRLARLGRLAATIRPSTDSTSGDNRTGPDDRATDPVAGAGS